MAGYSIKLSKELKESLASEFDSNWDSDRDDPVDVDVEPPPHPAQQNTATPRENGGHGSVSSESSDGKELEEEKDVDGKRRSKSIGSRLKRILSTDAKLPKLSESKDEDR